MASPVDVKTVTATQAADLADLVSGRVLLPGDHGFAAACGTFNLMNPLEPVVVVRAKEALDVQAAVMFAARHDFPVAVRATGHQVVRGTSGALLIDLSGMRGVVIDQALHMARAEGGARWQDVLDAAAPFALAPMAGSATTVGVVGYTLGGGLSPVLGRSMGYAADHVDSIEVVTADGRLRQVSAEVDPDLFWALLGGKGNFGVVTAIEFRLMPLTRFYGGGLYFAGEHAREVLNTWSEWVTDLPDEMTSSVAVQRLPPLPELPEPTRGAFVVHVRFAYLGSPEGAERLIEPFRSTWPVLLDGVREMPYQALAAIHLDPVEPLPYWDRTTGLEEFGPDVVDSLLTAIDADSGCPLTSVEIRALGGALDREPVVPNAVPSRGLPFVAFGFGVGGPEQEELMRYHLQFVIDQLSPWADERLLVNFLSADEATGPEELRRIYGEQRYDRLAAVKKTYDPDNRFRVNHNILPEE